MPSTTERVKASKIRTKIQVDPGSVTTEEAAWFRDYEAAREKVAQARGASQSRKVSYTEEESAAVGEGPEAAAAAASALPMAVKEEGQRLDSILTIGIAALKESNQVYANLVATMMKRTENFETTLVKMMSAQADLINAHRDSAIAQTEAEVRAIAAESGQEKDGISKMVEELLPLLLERMGK